MLLEQDSWVPDPAAKPRVHRSPPSPFLPRSHHPLPEVSPTGGRPGRPWGFSRGCHQGDQKFRRGRSGARSSWQPKETVPVPGEEERRPLWQ